jgi:hypothetical protein
MKNFSILKKSNEKQNESRHPLNGNVGRGYSENVLTPVTLFGVIVPWNRSMGDGRTSDFKLACASGVEYFIVADAEWRSVLSHYCWEDVKIKGLLNASNMTLVPQKVFPKGPTGERENVIDLAAWKGRDLVRKLTKNVTDLVLVPAAVFAVMS